MAGTWAPLQTQPSFNASTMLLLTDGTIMCHELDTNHWHLLSPNGSGSASFDQAYIQGSWSNLHDLNDDTNLTASQGGPTYAPRFFASAVLADGTVLVAGGEYNNIAVTGSSSKDVNTVELYDPLSDSWTNLSAPAGWSSLGDAPSCVLPDGRVMVGNSFLGTNPVALFDPATQEWESAASKLDSCSEEAFTLLPDGTILSVQCSNIPNSEKYIIASDQWQNEGSTQVTLPQQCPNIVPELGPAVLLTDGRVLQVGATGATAFYTPPATATGTGTWASGPTLTVTIGGSAQTMFPIDAPAALMPNGKVLCVGGPTPPCNFPGPTNFFEIDPTNNSATPITTNSGSGTPTPGNAGAAPFMGRMLLTANGQVLFSAGSNQIFVYTPDGSPQDAWRPTITNCPSELVLGHSYLISGTQLNGLSQACTYGDDAQMATNYPLVMLTHTGSGDRVFLRTSNHSTMGVATSTSTQSTNITVPTDLPQGAYHLIVIANGIASHPVDVTVAARDCFFTLDRSTFAQGEIGALINLNGAPATIDPAMYIVVEGFSATDLGLSASNLNSPPNAPAVTSPVSHLSFHPTGTVLAQDISQPHLPQRFTFPFSAQFDDTSMFADTTLFTQGIRSVTIGAELTAAGATVTSNAVIELTLNPNPFILHGDVAHGYPWYLSVDVRVFQVKADGRKFAVTLTDTGQPSHDATTFIKQAIANLNASPGSAGGEFDALPEDEQPASLALSPVDSGGTRVYNFALARVRYRDLTDATHVRAFFRMWQAQQTNATYNTTTTYPSQVNGAGERIPVLGVAGDEIMTIPFFAEPRVDATAVSLATQQDPANVLPIHHDPLGGEIDTYYGAWLDINQPTDKVFPPRLVAGAGTIPNGPFNNSGRVSIQELVRSEHQCLVVEVSFDPDPISPNADPSTSDKLAQRNLTFVNVPNPGAPASRRVPQTFEIRPTPQSRGSAAPDELMIEWGNLPHPSSAEIFLPGVDADQILALADALYSAHRLRKVGTNTIRCPAGGVSYLPIPGGSPVNFAGLLTLDLPDSVRKGDEYAVTVKQLTTMARFFKPELGAAAPNGRRRKPRAAAAAAQGATRNFLWRRVIGVFQLTIPVGTKTELLHGEEARLAIFKYIGQAIPPESRWFPVFGRYLDQLGGRVRLMGGDPGKVAPSPTGGWPEPSSGSHGRDEHGGDSRVIVTGKISRLIFDHFGDFEGFTLVTKDGDRRFESRECRLEEVVREAWAARLRVTVVAARHARHRPIEVMLHPPA